MKKEETIRFLPFHAINEFMRTDYKERVVRFVFERIDQIDNNSRRLLDKVVKNSVHVPGFRNSVKAPFNLKVKNILEGFEKSPVLVATLLISWANLNLTLQHQVFELLESRHWKLPPIEADRSKLPGFMTTWPKGEDFETLFQDFQAHFPESGVDSDDVSLMTVWVSGRLPYEIVENLFESSNPNNSTEPTSAKIGVDQTNL